MNTERLVRLATARSRRLDREVRTVTLTDDELRDLLVEAGHLRVEGEPGQRRFIPVRHLHEREKVVRLQQALRDRDAEIEAFRRAVITGDGPFCEDVCLRACIGPCEGLSAAARAVLEGNQQ